MTFGLRCQSFAYGFDDIGNRTETTNDGDMAVYTANLLNQYEQRDVPGRVRVLGSALPQAIITANNKQTTRQQDGYFHWSQAVTNTNSAAYPGVSILAVLQGAATNGADIVAAETGRVFVAKSPELFTYDLDGNLLTDGRWTNTWDGENRLIRVETRSDLPGDIPRVRADFTYDGQGRRIAEERFAHDGTNWMSTTSTRFLYDGWLLLAAVDDSGAFTRSYTWGLDLSGSMQGAGGVGGLLAMHQGGSDYAYAYDGNGNVIALIGTDGTTAAQYEYGPFGEPLRATGTAPAVPPSAGPSLGSFSFGELRGYEHEQGKPDLQGSRATPRAMVAPTRGLIGTPIAPALRSPHSNVRSFFADSPKKRWGLSVEKCSLLKRGS